MSSNRSPVRSARGLACSAAWPRAQRAVQAGRELTEQSRLAASSRRPERWHSDRRHRARGQPGLTELQAQSGSVSRTRDPGTSPGGSGRCLAGSRPGRASESVGTEPAEKQELRGPLLPRATGRGRRPECAPVSRTEIGKMHGKVLRTNSAPHRSRATSLLSRGGEQKGVLRTTCAEEWAEFFAWLVLVF